MYPPAECAIPAGEAQHFRTRATSGYERHPARGFPLLRRGLASRVTAGGAAGFRPPASTVVAWPAGGGAGRVCPLGRRNGVIH